MFTAELVRTIGLCSQESYSKAKNSVEQFVISNQYSDRRDAFRIFMDKMNLAEKPVQENGCYVSCIERIYSQHLCGAFFASIFRKKRKRYQL